MSLQKGVLTPALMVGAGLILVFWFWMARPAAPVTTVNPGSTSNSPPLGRVFAATHCQTCHLIPDPAQLDRRTWRDEVLPKMRYFTGMKPPNTNYFKDLQYLLAGGVFPKSPTMPEAAWNALADFYISSAPEKLVSPQDQERIHVGLKHFTAVPAKFRRSPARTTLARIDSQRRLVFMGDAESQAVDLLDPNGNRLSTIPLGNIPVGMTETESAFYYAAIGHFFPREEPRGQLLMLEKTPGGLRRQVIAENLPRATDVKVADLNNDGRADLALCMYGNFIGRFSWLESVGTNQFHERILLDKPGAIRCAVHDFNQDGKPDLAVLVAQALESLFIFVNDGKGVFVRHTALQRQPSWGHSGFELADFNGDGAMDLLVTNGDNADFATSPTKPYHGIRIYLNKGNLRFEEAWFFHLNGAYKAVARDFDKDGDLDLAAVSFFPDYELSPRESFVYLENRGGFDFEASTFRECISGRWLTLDAGDLDGDGYDDIVLGSLTEMPTVVPDALKKIWNESGPSIMILKNTAARSPSNPP